MAERFNAPVSKIGIPQGIVSSNLTVSAKNCVTIYKYGIYVLVGVYIIQLLYNLLEKHDRRKMP